LWVILSVGHETWAWSYTLPDLMDDMSLTPIIAHWSNPSLDVEILFKLQYVNLHTL